MAYWWINNKETRDWEVEGGYIWAPLTDKAGRIPFHYRSLNKMEAGDGLLLLEKPGKARIYAIARVMSEARETECPFPVEYDKKFPRQQNRGFMVDVEYHLLIKPILFSEIPRGWRDRALGPFDSRGNPMQGYAWDLSEEFVINLLHKFQDRVPKDIPLDLGVTPETPWSDQQGPASVIDGGTQEGGAKFRMHRFHERDRGFTRAHKDETLKRTGALCCEICGFDFFRAYGNAGKGLIEVHHTIPVASLRPGIRTYKEDLTLLCPNCHRMLHRSKKVREVKWLRSKLRFQINYL